ncbi:VOC family protein [Arthrobacter sp. NPDC056727]|uniref:VOC family protein n=1 Tax=Arthrobacter sp. NPDC056727 TaxID=3345927 RepID=UPI00366E8ACF
MSTVDQSSQSVAGSPPVIPGQFRLEVIVVPVSDVDRAKRFYAGLGWRPDAEAAVDDGYRLMQFTPPGSGCSIILGKGVTNAQPGSLQGLHLAVYDLDAARADLIARGVDVSEPFHDATGVFHHAGTRDASTARLPGGGITVRSPHSATRTATAGSCRRSRPGSRAAEPLNSERRGRWPQLTNPSATLPKP